jgi:magnesium-transporting ATPase (P-type)
MYYSSSDDDDDKERITPMPRNLSLLGVVAVADRVRPSSRQAIATAHAAGIQVVMVTGDRVETAVAVARDIGLLDVILPYVVLVLTYRTAILYMYTYAHVCMHVHV